MGSKSRKRRREARDALEEDPSHAGPSHAGPSHAGPAYSSAQASIPGVRVPSSGRLSSSAPAPIGGLTIANDEWQTTRRSWEAVAPHFAAWKSKRVWMPFYYDGVCAEHLRSLGFERVIHERADFFERVKDARFMQGVDLIWDNPPYTNQEIKERVLRALAATGKPFAMLLPISVLHVAFVREIVDVHAAQVIIPRRVHVRKHDGNELPFKYLCWFAVGARLPRDLLFADDEDDE